VVPVESRSGRSHAPSMLAALLTLPDDVKPAGRWAPLVEAMAVSAEQSQQLEMARAYWKLTAALARYRIAWDEYQLLTLVHDELGARGRSPDDLVRAQVRRGQAAAESEEAAGELLAAQNDLARRMRLPEGAPLPLPADKPHVGTYNTHFEQIYGTVAPPPGARFANRTLELRRWLVEDRAAVVQAAHDVLETEQESYAAGATPFSAWLAALDRWSRERRTFLAAVMQYNDQIAEYALNVPRAGLAPDSLVGMLIKAPIRLPAATESNPLVQQPRLVQQQPVQQQLLGQQQLLIQQQPPGQATAAQGPPVFHAGPAVQLPPGVQPAQQGQMGRASPATFNQPLPASAPIALPPPPVDYAGPRREPTLAPPRPGGRRPLAAQAETDENQPALLPKDIVPGAEPSSSLPSNLNAPGLEFGPHQVNRQPLPSGLAAAPAAVPADPGLYSALIGAAPAKRAQELAGLLNWNRTLPAEPSTPLSLEDCLAAVPDAGRQAAVAAYWRGRQAIAGYQAVMQEIEQLDAAAAAVLKYRGRPGGAEAMLQVRYARLSLEAARVEAQLTLLAEQFALTQLVHRPLDRPWSLPSTPPHGGGYRLKADAQPHAVADSFSFKRLTVVVPALHLTLEQQAEAVVLADAQRVAAASAAEAGSVGVEQLLAAVEQQANQTRAFLATLTRYNTEIGDYALVVLPPQSPAGTLVRAMVTPTTLSQQL
jgi:hypothetical protein